MPVRMSTWTIPDEMTKVKMPWFRGGYAQKGVSGSALAARRRDAKENNSLPHLDKDGDGAVSRDRVVSDVPHGDGIGRFDRPVHGAAARRVFRFLSHLGAQERAVSEGGRTRLQSWRLRLCMPRQSFAVPSRTVSVLPPVPKKDCRQLHTALLSGLLGRGNAPVSRSRVRVIRAGSETRWASRRLRYIRVRRGGGAHSARGRRSGVAVVGRASFSSGSTVAAAAGAAGSEPCQGVAVVCVLYGGTSRPRMPKFGAS